MSNLWIQRTQVSQMHHSPQWKQAADGADGLVQVPQPMLRKLCPVVLCCRYLFVVVSQAGNPTLIGRITEKS